ncbi:MAG: benzylsuccinate synthase gamma subunit family protein [Desulfosudaceae bacterium]
MTTCEQCKCFFPMEENPETGDCVRRGQDARQSFYKTQPVTKDQDAAACSDFQKK